MEKNEEQATATQEAPAPAQEQAQAPAPAPAQEQAQAEEEAEVETEAPAPAQTQEARREIFDAINSKMSGYQSRLGVLASITCGMLASIGGQIVRFGKTYSATMSEQDVLTKLAIYATPIIAPAEFDLGLARRCLKAHRLRKLASKLGVYEQYRKCKSDAEAQKVLDNAQGKVRKPRPTIPQIKRAVSAINGLATVADCDEAMKAVTERKAALEKAAAESQNS